MNLFSNSLKFTFDGYIKVKVENLKKQDIISISELDNN